MARRTVTIRVIDGRVRMHRGRNSSAALLERDICEPKAAPLLKWAGGKQWMSRFAPLLLPPGFQGRYYEPFLGAGAFFFATGAPRAMLSDLNAELIAAYDAIRNDVGRVIATLQDYPYSRDFYYYMRAKTPRTPHTHAARLVYLNRTCWNGLYRVNREGKFNVPFGRYRAPTICDVDRLRAAARLLARARLRTCDFDESVSNVSRGDFVYMDPPYITGHQNNGFHKYNSRLFSWRDQERLAALVHELSHNGVWVLVSNADQPQVAALYGGLFRYRSRRRSLIGGRGSKRGPVGEALFSNYPLMGIESEII